MKNLLSLIMTPLFAILVLILEIKTNWVSNLVKGGQSLFLDFEKFNFLIERNSKMRYLQSEIESKGSESTNFLSLRHN